MRNLDLLYTKGKAETASVYLPCLSAWLMVQPLQHQGWNRDAQRNGWDDFQRRREHCRAQYLQQDTVNQPSSTVLALLMMGKISEQSSSFTQRLGKQGKGGMLDTSFLCLQADSSGLHPMVGVCLNKAQKNKSRRHSSSLLTTTRKHHGTLNLLLPSCSQAWGGGLCLLLWPTTVREYHTKYR